MLPATSGCAAPRVTVAVMPDEQVVPVTVPLAQYVKESDVALPLGVYVKVPFAQIDCPVGLPTTPQVTVPWLGGVKSVTPNTLISLAITPLAGSETVKVWVWPDITFRELYRSFTATAAAAATGVEATPFGLM